MTPRTPSSVPFTILIVVGAAIVPFLGKAMAYANYYWAFALLLTAVLISGALLLLMRRLQQFPTVGLAALWLVPVLILAFERNWMVVVCAVPMLVALQRYLPAVSPPRGYAIVSAMLLQGTLALQLSGHVLGALSSLCAGIGLIVWAKEPSIRPFHFRLGSATAAILITLFLLGPIQLIVPGGAVAKASAVPIASTSTEKGSSASAHLGLIFRPELKKVDRKLPPPPRLDPLQTFTVAATPIDIPFSGFYWLFQLPLSGPPANSPVIKASPGEGKYRSDDETPVRFEAHQDFNSHFPIRRLSSIEVTLLSNDTYPTTLSLELIALSTELRQHRISFGRKPIEFLPAPQTVSFQMPPSPSVDEFDELILRVHLAVPRLNVSPRITIQKFRFYPR
ncbi:MAG: hypothetical protein ABIQ44_06860 [Chloroflexia bacterium]